LFIEHNADISTEEKNKIVFLNLAASCAVLLGYLQGELTEKLLSKMGYMWGSSVSV
jgi:hypothetical protein